MNVYEYYNRDSSTYLPITKDVWSDLDDVQPGKSVTVIENGEEFEYFLELVQINTLTKFIRKVKYNKDRDSYEWADSRKWNPYLPIHIEGIRKVDNKEQDYYAYYNGSTCYCIQRCMYRMNKSTKYLYLVKVSTYETDVYGYSGDNDDDFLLYNKELSKTISDELEKCNNNDLPSFTLSFNDRKFDVDIGPPLLQIDSETGEETIIKLYTKFQPSPEVFNLREPYLSAPNTIFRQKSIRSIKEDIDKISFVVEDQSKFGDGDECCICCCDLKGSEAIRRLNVCFDCFHEGCLKEYINQTSKPECPLCKRIYLNIIGSQPDGSMTDSIESISLPGYEDYDTIVINYNMNSGTVKSGEYYNCFNRKAYLPNNDKGKLILELLKKAFENKATFCVVRNDQYSAKIDWNGIHHKTNINGGLSRYGYPDPNYLDNVLEKLKLKGFKKEEENAVDNNNNNNNQQ